VVTPDTFLARDYGPQVVDFLTQARPDVVKRRTAWFESQLDLDPGALVFIDETAAPRWRAAMAERPAASV
jgi:hypothetical protein